MIDEGKIFQANVTVFEENVLIFLLIVFPNLRVNRVERKYKLLVLKQRGFSKDLLFSFFGGFLKRNFKTV